MNITGIIAEYNPFHNGHAWHLSEARRLTACDYLVVVMSGDFVQRGEPAILDKFARTQMALSNGADLVIELPVRFACASAEFFATGSVKLLNGLGCITHLCFGSECGNIALLKETAALLHTESDSYRSHLQAALKSGCSFPKARTQALCECGHARHAAILDSPNNILGVEYCRALQTFDSSIQPVTIPRQGASYHSTELSHSLCSATAIRTSILKEERIPYSALPETVQEILIQKMKQEFPVTANDFSALLYYQLLLAQTWQDLADIFDVPENLAKRIFRLRFSFQDFDSFTELLKTKNITELSIRRALTHILLQLKVKHTDTPYARILGFKKTAGPLLKEIAKTASIPIITKPSQYPHLLAEDLFASQVYHSILTQKYGAAPYDELRQPLLIF